MCGERPLPPRCTGRNGTMGCCGRYTHGHDYVAGYGDGRESSACFRFEAKWWFGALPSIIQQAWRYGLADATKAREGRAGGCDRLASGGEMERWSCEGRVRAVVSACFLETIGSGNASFEIHRRSRPSEELPCTARSRIWSCRRGRMCANIGRAGGVGDASLEAHHFRVTLDFLPCRINIALKI